TMGNRPGVGFVAGVLGAVILIILFGILQLAGMGAPSFVKVYQATFGAQDVTVAWIVGAILFALSGGIWGAIFGLIVKDPTVGKGMLFGILPTLWVWLFVAPVLQGQPVFFGFKPMSIVMPIIANVLIWGSFVGWYCRRRYVARPVV
ncbi:MAG TPA: hypothetical protein VFG50_05760, partial [Rhodothermales bacterium]|nr:hypothetical protein [Rhodothermales bacterium]